MSENTEHHENVHIPMMLKIFELFDEGNFSLDDAYCVCSTIVKWVEHKTKEQVSGQLREMLGSDNAQTVVVDMSDPDAVKDAVRKIVDAMIGGDNGGKQG